MKNITISIVTVCLNSEKSIAYTLHSVFNQTYKKNIEHIIVDGGSSDETVKIIKKHKIKKKIIIAKNSNIYNALNIAIKNCSGEYILILHSDDILNNSKIIEDSVNIISKKRLDVYLGNVTYFNNINFSKIVRFYSAQNFELSDFKWGLMPPHPGCFIKSKIAKENLYDTNYEIASDFDFFLRILKIKKVSYQKINLTITRMRTAGVSGQNLFAHIKSGMEIYQSLKKNRLFASHIMIIMRLLLKIKQFIIIESKYSKFALDDYYEQLNYYHFKIITNIKKLNYNNNFTLSALNLAFLGSFFFKEVRLYKNLIHWPDGKYAKSVFSNLKKTPGRQILNELNIPKKIKQLTIFGNLTDKSEKFIQQKYHRKIYKVNLPYGSIKKIIKNLSYKITKKELIFITLPTPKQEQLAEYLISTNKIYKIICIGGSINISSGEETEVPNFLYNFEFLWRLRYETRRRILRLMITMYQFFIGKYFYKKLRNLNIKIIS